MQTLEKLLTFHIQYLNTRKHDSSKPPRVLGTDLEIVY